VRPFLCRHNAKHDVPRLRPVSLQFPDPVAIQQQNCTYPDIQGYSQLAKAVSMAIMALAEYTLAKTAAMPHGRSRATKNGGSAGFPIFVGALAGRCVKSG
jgi:hypothetical protein